MADELIHVYRQPPQTGDTAVCGHVREDEMEGHRLHRSDNQCQVCLDIAAEEGMTVVARTALDPPGVWRAP